MKFHHEYITSGLAAIVVGLIGVAYNSGLPVEPSFKWGVFLLGLGIGNLIIGIVTWGLSK